MILLDGKVSGIIGLAREEWTSRLFSEHKPELEPFLKSVIIMRAVKAVMRWVREYPTDVFAVAKHEKGCQILTRLGFERIGDRDVFVWVN